MIKNNKVSAVISNIKSVLSALSVVSLSLSIVKIGQAFIVPFLSAAGEFLNIAILWNHYYNKKPLTEADPSLRRLWLSLLYATIYILLGIALLGIAIAYPMLIAVLGTITGSISIISGIRAWWQEFKNLRTEYQESNPKRNLHLLGLIISTIGLATAILVTAVILLHFFAIPVLALSISTAIIGISVVAATIIYKLIASHIEKNSAPVMEIETNLLEKSKTEISSNSDITITKALNTTQTTTPTRDADISTQLADLTKIMTDDPTSNIAIAMQSLGEILCQAIPKKDLDTLVHTTKFTNTDTLAQTDIDKILKNALATNVDTILDKIDAVYKLLPEQHQKNPLGTQLMLLSIKNITRQPSITPQLPVKTQPETTHSTP